jgi:hypothetical protein
MEVNDQHKSPNARHPGLKARLPYSAPTFKRLSPDEAKDLILQRADTRDPQVMRMLDCIDQLQRKKAK